VAAGEDAEQVRLMIQMTIMLVLAVMMTCYRQATPYEEVNLKNVAPVALQHEDTLCCSLPRNVCSCRCLWCALIAI
jgi:hypothetical protein